MCLPITDLNKIIQNQAVYNNKNKSVLLTIWYLRQYCEFGIIWYFYSAGHIAGEQGGHSYFYRCIVLLAVNETTKLDDLYKRPG